MNKKHWDSFYKSRTTEKPSSFTEYVNEYLTGKIVDLGCGNGRDYLHFVRQGMNACGVDQVDWTIPNYTKQDILEYVKNNKSPESVYTRFVWHAIERDVQLEILKWAKNLLFIEARTTQDKKNKKTFDNHERNYVSVPQLVADLKDNGFEIIKLEEGYGMAKFRGEDPHIIRVIARKS